MLDIFIMFSTTPSTESAEALIQKADSMKK
jgi:hypothetical protein